MGRVQIHAIEPASMLSKPKKQASMKFHISYEFAPESRNEIQAQFKATGGLPGEGVTMIGRYHAIEGLTGFILAESDDPIAIGKWMQEWTHSISFEIVPVVDDAGIAEVIG
jgi:hypothetical protein